MASRPKKRRFRKPTKLFNAGDRSDFIYRVVEGAAEEDGNTIRAGGFIGEIGVLVGSPRGASVTVAAGTTLEQLTRKDFLQLIFADPALAQALLHSLSLRSWALMERLCRQRQGLSTMPTLIERQSFRVHWLRAAAKITAFLAESLRRRVKFIPEDLARKGRREHAAAFAAFEDLHVSKGSFLFEEGGPSDAVYWIKSGTIEVVKKTPGGERVVGRPRTNDVVGEIGVIEGMPRAAGARAITDVVVQVVPNTTFHELVRTSPTVYLQVVDALCERARFLMHRLRTVPDVDPGAAQELALFHSISSMESVVRLAEQRFANELLKMRRLFQTQVEHGKEIVDTYRKYSRGEALPEELERANAHFIDYLKLAGLGALLVLPGAPLSIPLASKMGKAMGIDIFPTSDDEPVGS